MPPESQPAGFEENGMQSHLCPQCYEECDCGADIDGGESCLLCFACDQENQLEYHVHKEIDEKP